MFEDCWKIQTARAAETIEALKTEANKVEGQITKLVDRIVDATNPRVVSAIEKRIDEMERQQVILREKAANSQKPRYSFDELFELSIRFLSSPCFIWNSGRPDLQRLVLKLVFSEHLTYSRDRRLLEHQNLVTVQYVRWLLRVGKRNGAQGQI